MFSFRLISCVLVTEARSLCFSRYQRGCFLAWKQCAGKRHLLQDHHTQVLQLGEEVSKSQMREKIRIEGLTTKLLRLWTGLHLQECHGRWVAESVVSLGMTRTNRQMYSVHRCNYCASCKRMRIRVRIDYRKQAVMPKRVCESVCNCQ